MNVEEDHDIEDRARQSAECTARRRSEHDALSMTNLADQLVLTFPPIRAEGWNPRYAAFALEHGRTPEAQIASDKARGTGCMLDFMMWIQGKWHEWDKLRGFRGAWPHHSPEDHEAFDRWLSGRGWSLL